MYRLDPLLGFSLILNVPLAECQHIVLLALVDPHKAVRRFHVWIPTILLLLERVSLSNDNCFLVPALMALLGPTPSSLLL